MSYAVVNRNGGPAFEVTSYLEEAMELATCAEAIVPVTDLLPGEFISRWEIEHWALDFSGQRHDMLN